MNLRTHDIEMNHSESVTQHDGVFATRQSVRYELPLIRHIGHNLRRFRELIAKRFKERLPDKVCAGVEVSVVIKRAFVRIALVNQRPDGVFNVITARLINARINLELVEI